MNKEDIKMRRERLSHLVSGLFEGANELPATSQVGYGNDYDIIVDNSGQSVRVKKPANPEDRYRS